MKSASGSRSRRLRRPSTSRMEGIESQKSVTIPACQLLLCPSGPTPTTVAGTPLIGSVVPTTDGDASNLVVQA